MNSERPFFGIADLENDPTYKAVYDRLDVQGKKAIMEMVKAPKETNPEAEAKVQDLIFGTNKNAKPIAEYTAAEFQKMTVGLNKSDKAKYTNQFNKIKNETLPEERSKNNRAEKLLQEQLLAVNYIQKDEYGKYKGKSEIKLIEARNELLDFMDTAPKNMNDTELRKYVQKYAADKKLGQAFAPPPRKVFTETKTETIPQDNSVVQATKKAVVKNMQEMDLAEKVAEQKMRSAYRKQFGAWPKVGSVEYNNFKKNNSK